MRPVDALDDNACQLCAAYGEDKRSLTISCGYALHTVVPAALNLANGEHMADSVYHLRICKACRGRFLALLEVWGIQCRAMRDVPKDCDGKPTGKALAVRPYGGR